MILKLINVKPVEVQQVMNLTPVHLRKKFTETKHLVIVVSLAVTNVLWISKAPNLKIPESLFKFASIKRK
jgi:hypothetical protein